MNEQRKTNHRNTLELVGRAIHVTIMWPHACSTGISDFVERILHVGWTSIGAAKIEERLEELIRDQHPDHADEWLRRVGFQLEEPYIPEPGHWFKIERLRAEDYGPYLAVATTGNSLCDAVRMEVENITGGDPCVLHVDLRDGKIMFWPIAKRHKFTRVNPDGTPWEEDK